MKNSIKTGLSFGLTSGVITTVGLMVGLASSTTSKLAVIGGIVTIAVADAFSDALGIHISEEAKAKNGAERAVWMATIATFLTKFIFASLFILPVVFFSLNKAIWVSVAFGALILIVLSFNVARDRKESTVKVILEHLSIALVVVVLANWLGEIVSKYFR